MGNAAVVAEANAELTRQQNRMRAANRGATTSTSSQIRCGNCQRTLMPPANSPNLFRCPCGEIIRNQARQQQAARQPQSSGNRVQCNACYGWLIPPPGAPRFRCTCGNILENPNVTHRHARCPRCTQTLVAPEGHSRFRCPCGQMLTLLQTRLRCPTCSVVLMPPPGAARFRCPCGVVLRTPAAQLQVSAQREGDVRAPRAKAVTRDELDLSVLDNLQLGRPTEGKNTGSETPIARQTSMRERMLQRLDQLWDRKIDEESLQTLWTLKPTDTGDAIVDETETKAWVRSLRPDGSLAWRDADVVDHAEGVSAPKDWAQPPSQNVHKIVLEASKLPFGKKLTWFRRQIERLKVDWQHGHQTIRVKRSNLLETSTHAIMKIAPQHFHQIFRFEFVGEPAKDAGGVAREFYDQLTKTLFNPDFGLFKQSADLSSYQLNPSSGMFNDHHLLYFRFAGRLMGKALFDGQLVDAHLVTPLYKHILGHPILTADLQFIDSSLYSSLRMLPSLDEDDIEDLCKTFVVEKSEFGALTTEELKPGGADIDVTLANVVEYSNLLVQYYVFSSAKEQLRYLLQGFYEVVPHYLVSVFDSQELEVLLCGLDRVDIDDWRKHTEFRGTTNELHAEHDLVKWFFECCEEMSDPERSKLLQWCTGCARVPIEGFVALQSHDGKLCRFALKSVPLKNENEFPVAHTCFNRIDLPKYRTKEHLKEKLQYVLKADIGGFEIE